MAKDPDLFAKHALPVVFERDGKVFANSRDVAEYFQKRNTNVNRDIRNLIANLPWESARLNFEPNEIKDLTGVSIADYDMTRDGFALLAMGFTGPEALSFKLRYIAQFNAMEEALRRAPAVPDFSDPVVLIALLTEHTTKRIEAEKRAAAAEEAVEVAKPKADFYDAFVSADGLYGLQNAARVLSQRPNKFIGWLKAGFLFYQGGVLVPKVQYREMGIFEVKATDVDGKARYQTYVTPKGIQYLSKKLGVDSANGEI